MRRKIVEHVHVFSVTNMSFEATSATCFFCTCSAFFVWFGFVFTDRLQRVPALEWTLLFLGDGDAIEEASSSFFVFFRG
jgi:hypothetical protein